MTDSTSIAPPAPGAAPRAGLSIRDFITDGSLAALCAELTRLAGVRVALRDPRGGLVGRGVTPEVLSEDGERRPGEDVIPLNVDGQRIGELAVSPGEPALGADARDTLKRALVLLASTAVELCERQVELRHMVKEVSALLRLGSLLSRAASVDRVLDVALESAMDVLQLDAGSLVLLRDGDVPVTGEIEEDLVLKSHRNLSRDWLDCTQPLSKNRLFDRMALSGEIVTVADLRADDRVLIADRVLSEGLVAFINAGLTFKNRPIGIIRLYAKEPRTFTDAERKLLKSIADQAAVAVEQARLLKVEDEEKRVQRQLDLAADVQRRMLPHTIPTVPGLSLAARYVPSFELGGDFYDFLKLGGHLGVVVGDVVGKGIAAALLMSAVRASLRAHAEEVYDIDEIVSRVNAAMCHDTRDNEFASLWYGVLDPATLRLTYCSAGHEPVFVVPHVKGRAAGPHDVKELNVGGMVVGVEPEQRYQRGVFDLRPGDTLVAYTDGVVDAVNFSGEKFRKKRLHAAVLRALAAEPDANAPRILERLVWEMRQFAGLATRPDDETLVVMRVNPKG